ncbi:hypothetical protein BY996DRAFT_6420270 [Phakopsora pachyrhizi]|uniref:Expressed protein n=1 Tax=Phakopsora pachyrhizi TaxID=170000 RepID=A0AAV0AQX5_PHAPC|nr:hypothetical protein BY996DRAFT_6420270 [Phakopsora pachyrhizi]CAH7670720.1 expressed protein [Phakopsora pachyrhizi]
MALTLLFLLKLDEKAPSTSILRLLGDDPIKQHDLEYFHQVGEYPLMVNIHHQNFPSDSQSFTSHHPRNEGSFSSGKNELQGNVVFGDLRSNSDSINAISDTCFLNHPYITENFEFTSPGNDLHYSFSENSNQINGGTLPEKLIHYLPEISADLNHDPEQHLNSCISSIQGDYDYQLYDNYLHSDHNYQDYSRHPHQDLSSDLDKNYGHPVCQDYGTYHYQDWNSENCNFNRKNQILHNQANNVPSLSRNNVLHLNLEKSDAQDLFRNFDIEKNSLKDKRPPAKVEICGISSEDFHRHEIFYILSKSASKGSSERTNNEGEIATIYPDFTASYKPQQPDMQFNHYESAGVHSPDTQSSSFNWPSIEEWLGSGSNEALENIGVGDFKSNIGNISYNIENENLDDPHNKENSMIIGSGEIPSFFFKENLNDINGGIISEGGFPSPHELSVDLNYYADQGHIYLFPTFRAIITIKCI